MQTSKNAWRIAHVIKMVNNSDIGNYRDVLLPLESIQKNRHSWLLQHEVQTLPRYRWRLHSILFKHPWSRLCRISTFLP